MEDLSKYTLIELQKMGNDIKDKHDQLRKELINDTHKMSEIEKQINNKVAILDNLEKNYINIVEKLVE